MRPRPLIVLGMVLIGASAMEIARNYWLFPLQKDVYDLSSLGFGHWTMSTCLPIVHTVGILCIGWGAVGICRRLGKGFFRTPYALLSVAVGCVGALLSLVVVVGYMFLDMQWLRRLLDTSGLVLLYILGLTALGCGIGLLLTVGSRRVGALHKSP